jgi:hypothetical protein
MMAKRKTATKTQDTNEDIVDIHSLEWTDYVLSKLSEDEKIAGNPTTDGLRRIFEKVMNCVIIESTSDVVQSPSPTNEKRATVVHSLSYYINDESLNDSNKVRTVNGAADVYWGNCDKVYRNHPVAVAETRAEGRALRRGLRLRKVVAAEELTDSTEDDIGADNVTKITNNQINFIDALSKRLDINVIELIKSLDIKQDNVKTILHSDALSVIRELSSFQQKTDDIPQTVKGYINNWSQL